ncbi:kinase-like protein, partial [Piedraia hortae CBS 480.64]
INHYQIIDELGRGAYGKVKLGRDMISGTHVAIKIVERYSKRRKLGKIAASASEDKVKREVAILKKARHPNIVALLEVIDDPRSKKVYIVLEYVTPGEIKWRLEFVPAMTQSQIRIAFRDTLVGLQYLHYQGIIHRDIKPPNLLATSDGRVKISDFGVSYLGRPLREGESGEDASESEMQVFDGARQLAMTVGTPAFYAPELCINCDHADPPPVTKAIDVWALGITLFCMLFARTPFVDDSFVVMRYIVERPIYIPRKRLVPTDAGPSTGTWTAVQPGKRGSLDIEYEAVNESLRNLLARLLEKDPRKRITLEEVRRHPWVSAD